MCVGQLYFSLHYVVRIMGKDMNYIWAEKIFFMFVPPKDRLWMR